MYVCIYTDMFTHTFNVRFTYNFTCMICLRCAVMLKDLIHRALGGCVQTSRWMTPPNLCVVAELCVIICSVWAGPLMTGLDTPIKGPSAHGQKHYNLYHRYDSLVSLSLYLSLSIYIYI